MRGGILVVLLAFGVLALGASPASAATCDNYDNQADAQRAADTRDPDNDGIYCESLPCPCLNPGEGGGGGGDPQPAPAAKPKPAKPRAQEISARITDVTDGDTIKVRAYGATRKFYDVRLIGIDTPETKKPGVGVECGGPAATSRMFDLAFSSPVDSDGDGLYDEKGGDGRRVTLRTDPTQDLFDRYDRLLAYVTTSGTMLQRRMLSAGWATTYVYDSTPFQKVKKFRAAERRARDADRGVYDRCGGDFHSEQ
jgi:micrococcal nuclease